MISYMISDTIDNMFKHNIISDIIQNMALTYMISYMILYKKKAGYHL